MTDILLKRAEAARQLGISERTITRMEISGELPRVTLSTRIIRYRQSDIDAIISSNSSADFSYETDANGHVKSFSRQETAPNDRVQSFSRQLVVAERPAVTRSVPIGKNFHK